MGKLVWSTKFINFLWPRKRKFAQNFPNYFDKNSADCKLTKRINGFYYNAINSNGFMITLKIGEFESFSREGNLINLILWLHLYCLLLKMTYTLVKLVLQLFSVVTLHVIW